MKCVPQQSSWCFCIETDAVQYAIYFHYNFPYVCMVDYITFTTIALFYRDILQWHGRKSGEKAIKRWYETDTTICKQINFSFKSMAYDVMFRLRNFSASPHIDKETSKTIMAE